MSDKIHPLHWSYKKLLRKGIRIKPKNMSYLNISDQDAQDTLTNIALDIFVDCTNAGIPFQDALTAIYLSGLDHGVNGRKKHV
ncbi:hypothetical protein CMI37_09070 [Candidatus Pacearchaeota archaeon]|nr:hypothetical protein [Candidatus Pacearchaeota archaeon]